MTSGLLSEPDERQGVFSGKFRMAGWILFCVNVLTLPLALASNIHSSGSAFILGALAFWSSVGWTLMAWVILLVQWARGEMPTGRDARVVATLSAWAGLVLLFLTGLS